MEEKLFINIICMFFFFNSCPVFIHPYSYSPHLELFSKVYTVLKNILSTTCFDVYKTYILRNTMRGKSYI